MGIDRLSRFCAVMVGPLLIAACASSDGASTRRGPDAAVPMFAADDERVNTAGFISETLRLHEERDGVRHTLMAFVVGDTLSLGAMVKGEFHGLVRWKVGGRRFSLPFDTVGPMDPVPITVEAGPSAAMAGHGASFRGTTWVNVDVPIADWVEDGTALQLVFLPRVGAPLFLPDDGYHYRVKLVQG